MLLDSLSVSCKMPPGLGSWAGFVFCSMPVFSFIGLFSLLFIAWYFFRMLRDRRDTPGVHYGGLLYDYRLFWASRLW